MYAILDAVGYQDASTVQNVIRFYETARNRPLYTYVISATNEPQVYLQLRDWDAEQAGIPLEEYPTLQSVGIDFVNTTLSGNCTLPVSATNTTTRPCMSGTFDNGKQLALTITSRIPLNTTAFNATQPAAVTTRLRIDESAWSYSQSDVPPELTLHDVNDTDNSLGAVVLRTAVTKPHDCTQLKVCLSGLEGKLGEGGEAGAQVLAPLAVVFVKQVAYATVCTAPSGYAV